MHMGKRTYYRDEVVPMTSSVPLALPARQKKLFREVLTLLNEQELPYAVSGAFALREYTGICRYTKDLDVFLSAQLHRKLFAAWLIADLSARSATPYGSRRPIVTVTLWT